MKKGLFITVFYLVSFQAAASHAEDYGWAQTYVHSFAHHEMHNNAHKHELFFNQANVKPFTQLIFSWNAHRPKEGYFTFYAQVRDAKTKQWYDYHKMVDWGESLQRSHFNRSKGSAFHYARLELDSGKKADGFRIKVTADQHHDLGLIKALIVTISDFTEFKPEPWVEHGKGLQSLVLTGIPKTSQILVNHPKADVMCSPTSTSMVIGSLQRKKIDALLFADHVYDQGLDAFGNWAFNTAHAYELCNGKVLFYPTRLGSFTDLYSILKNKIPVVVSVRGPLKGAPKAYEKGHLLVVIGYDAQTKQVICHDPAFDTDEAVLTQYDVHEFIRAWERSRRVTYKPYIID